MKFFIFFILALSLIFCKKKDLADNFVGQFSGNYSEIGKDVHGIITATITKKTSNEVSIEFNHLSNFLFKVNAIIKNDTLMEFPNQVINQQQIKPSSLGILKTQNDLLINFDFKSVYFPDSVTAIFIGKR